MFFMCTELKDEQVPDHYEETFKYFSRQGRRVIALGYRKLEGLEMDQVRRLSREDVEQKFVFGGFGVFECPLKPDSANTIKQLVDSSHKVYFFNLLSDKLGCYDYWRQSINCMSSFR